jgi:hypothetical protein
MKVNCVESNLFTENENNPAFVTEKTESSNSNQKSDLQNYRAGLRKLRSQTFVPNNIQELIIERQHKEAYPNISEKLMQHFLDASRKKINPIELAFQKFDLDLAEEIFKIRQEDIRLGRPTFEFPGYDFKRQWKGGTLDVWMKSDKVKYLNKWGGIRYFTLNRIDTDAISLLMKYDEKGLWKEKLGFMTSMSYGACDQEGYLFCLKLFPQIEVNTLAWKIMQGELQKKPAYLVNPFLSDFPIDLNNPSHLSTATHPLAVGDNRSAIWDYRPEDNEKIRALKRELQDYLYNNLSWEDGKPLFIPAQ